MAQQRVAGQPLSWQQPLAGAMVMEHISYKNITIALLVVVAVLSIAHTVITKLQFRDAALRAQAASLPRVIEVASDETMKLVHNEAFLLANDLQSRLIDPRTRQLLDQQALRTVLDDLFIHGFAGAGALDLAKLRVNDSGLHLVTQSGQGAQDLPESAPGFPLPVAHDDLKKQQSNSLRFCSSFSSDYEWHYLL